MSGAIASCYDDNDDDREWRRSVVHPMRSHGCGLNRDQGHFTITLLLAIQPSSSSPSLTLSPQPVHRRGGEVEDNSPFPNPLARSEGLLRCGEDRRKGEEGRGNESDRKGGRKPYPPNKIMSGYGELCLLFVLVGRCGDTTAQRLRRTRVSVLVKLRVYDVRFLLERNHSKPPLPRST